MPRLPITMCLVISLTAAPTAALSAQTLQAPSIAGMTATQVGAEPAMRVSTARYMAEAAALDAWVVAADRLVPGRSRDASMLAFARMTIPTHLTALRTRGGTLALPPPWAARLGRMRAATGAEFGRLFVADQIAAHRRLWSLHTGYAIDGSDPRLKRAAAAAVSMEECELQDLPMRPMPY